MTSGTDKEVPVRSLRQRMDALDRANEIRTYRAQIKRNLKAGRTTIQDILANPPRELETMHLVDLLLAVPRLGRVKVNKLLRQGHISPSKTVGGMTGRQLDELLLMLKR